MHDARSQIGLHLRMRRFASEGSGNLGAEVVFVVGGHDGLNATNGPWFHPRAILADVRQPILLPCRLRELARAWTGTTGLAGVGGG